MRRRGSEPKCPFCGRKFERPQDIKTEFGNLFSGGKCECGAVFVYDRSGHNLGEAYVDGLVFACNGDWNAAWNLVPETDYKILSFYYDLQSHTLSEIDSRGVRTKENLLFIELKIKK